MRTALTRAFRVLADCLGPSTTGRSAAAATKAIPPSRRCFVDRSSARAMCEPLEERTLMSTYYISPSGNDSNSGTSISKPWKTINKVNNSTFKAGDYILFQGDQTFDGTLSISSKHAGNSTTPVIYGSYSGVATIYSGKSDGAYVYSASGVWFEGLNFEGSVGSGLQSGINFQMYSGTASNDRVNGCTITGYFEAGLLIEGTSGSAGVTGLQITDNSIHDNVTTGIYTVAAADNSIRNIYISGNQVYNNYGDGKSYVTGSGIELGDVNGAIVQYNSAYLNGSKGGNGGVGIWAYSSNDVTFQYNQSYDNVTTRGDDGDGFDFDLDVSNSVMQYNFSAGNDGAGFALNQWQNNNDGTNDVIRYNISQDNGLKDNYSGIDVWGKVENAKIYNNTVYSIKPLTGITQAIRISNNEISSLHPSNVLVVDNVFVSTGGTTLVNATSAAMNGASNIVFAGNDYYSSGSTFNISYAGANYNSLSAWQSKTRQEEVSGKSVGLSVNPMFVSAGNAKPVANANTISSITAYDLLSNSPLFSSSLSTTAASLLGNFVQTTDLAGTAITSAAVVVDGAVGKK
jgi:hypothetical protein